MVKQLRLKNEQINITSFRQDTSKRPILMSSVSASTCMRGEIKLTTLTGSKPTVYIRSGQISTMDELTVIMRSLGMSPTITELKSYMRDKGGKISFADFLEIMHGHSKKESIPRELLEAFRGMDPQRKGYIPAKVK